MNKQEYKEMRKTNNYDLEKFYDYYVANWKELAEQMGYQKLLTLEEFAVHFMNVFNSQSKRILAYLDTAFELNVLFSAKGKVIDVY